MRDHTRVCGYGGRGRLIARDVTPMRDDVVVIDSSPASGHSSRSSPAVCP
jgi:voltage-gated potassium channel Kch